MMQVGGGQNVDGFDAGLQTAYGPKALCVVCGWLSLEADVLCG